MIVVRPPESIHVVRDTVDGGSVEGRWHFSFDDYADPRHVRFGQLRVLNDETLGPGATRPLRALRHNELLTYVATGELCPSDERGKGEVVVAGGAYHLTAGRGAWYAEANARADRPLRLVRMEFLPEVPDLAPSTARKAVTREQRRNGLLPIAGGAHAGALPLRSEATVFSSFLEAGRTVSHPLDGPRGAYVYLLEGGPVRVNARGLPALGAAELSAEPTVRVSADADAELLLVETRL